MPVTVNIGGVEHRITDSGQCATAGIARKSTTEQPVVFGHAAVFYDPTDEGSQYELYPGPDRTVERISPGAFDGALERKDDAAALINHDANLLIGRVSADTLKLSVDKTGLYYEAFPGDTSIAADAIAQVERGEMWGASFSFQVDRVRWEEEKQPDGSTLFIREILSVSQLWDIAVCVFPAYRSATAGVRRSTQQPSPRWQTVRRTIFEHVTVPSNKSALAVKLAGMRAKCEAIAEDDRKWRASQAEAERVRAAQYAAANAKRYPMDRASIAARLREIERHTAGVAR